jgi:UDP-GlcNAc:undecaprenyl-phosphate GlcNAc-1-phosphate transferase
MDATLQYVPILIFGFAASLGLTPLSRQIAMRFGIVDKPNQPRKTHKDHKPMMGGLAIYLALSISVLLFSPLQHIHELLAIVGGAGLLAFIGLIDDRYNLSWRLRFGVQFLAAAVLIVFGIQIRLFGLWFIDIPITLIWVVALSNATNFLDNMDGLTAGLSAIASAWFLLIAITQGQILVSMLAAAILGSAIGFLTYNFAPSSTFMGDMGALPLGFLLATLAIKMNFASHPLSVTWMIPLLVLALPIFDINLVIWTRLSEKRSPTQAGRDHTSHRIQAVGFNARQTLFILYSLCLLFGGIAFLISAVPADYGMKIGTFGLSVLLLLWFAMWWIRAKFQKEIPDKQSL